MSTRVAHRFSNCGAGLALIAALLLGFSLVACGGSSMQSSPSASSAPSVSPTSLRLMEFNIEYGGTQVSFAKVVEAVKKAGPDVVALEEAETNTGRLAKAAGYPYWNDSIQVVSRYPILTAPEAKGNYVFIELTPGRGLALANVHLPSDDPGPQAIRRGAPLEKVLAAEQKYRVPYIQTALNVLPPLTEQGIPVFLAGDFNAPSWRDYTQDVVGTRDYVKYVVEWPVSKAVEAAGFTDSWRVVYPDPLKSLGLTWWAGRPKVAGWNPGPNSPRDRIDFIYSMGPAKATAAQLAGETGGPEVTFGVKPWPSDHRAVMTTFSVTPGALPVMVTPRDPVVTLGESIDVAYVRPPGSGDFRVQLVPAGKEMRLSLFDESVDALAGTVSFASTSLRPGDYDLVLTRGIDPDTVLARGSVSVVKPGARPVLRTDGTAYGSGEPIVVTWKNAPAYRWDWLGVYKASAADPNVDSYLIWQYTGGAGSGTSAGAAAGTLTMDEGTVEGGPWPLPKGDYVLYYLLADGYKWVARTEFRVK
jgi:endonuclease/exonuclease/phosphatase family metal-dependent hydrolase